MSASIHVEPSGLEFEVAEHQTIFDAAVFNNIYWPTTCEGNATCTRCFFEVISGEQFLSSMSAAEREALDNIRWRGEVRESERLACQTKITGNVNVYRRGVKIIDAMEEGMS